MDVVLRSVFGICMLFDLLFFFKQKTAYEMRISDWSSDVCSSDLQARRDHRARHHLEWRDRVLQRMRVVNVAVDLLVQEVELAALVVLVALRVKLETAGVRLRHVHGSGRRSTLPRRRLRRRLRSEEHTSELQSLMRISYAVFCLKNKNHIQ